MPKRTLTEAGIKRLPKALPGKRGAYPDLLAPGLILRVTERGVKTWSVYYTPRGGKQQRLTLGPWPGIGVAEARTKAREVRERARRGVDPKRALHAEERAEAEATNSANTTFGGLATAYINRETPKLANGEKYASAIHRWLMPAWRDVPAEDLRRRHLTAVTDNLIDRGKPAMASHVQILAKRIFSWALDRGEVELHPFAGMRAPTRQEPRQRVLTRAEIAALWAAWDDTGYPFGALQQFLLLTAQRRGEVAGMTWGEVEAATWTIPAERSKSNREMIVPLSDMAVELLAGLPRLGSFVFTSRGHSPVSGFSKARAQAERDSGVTGWRFHDLRRTCRTGLARLGVPEIVAERCLNHAPKGLSAVYNVHQYEEEKREAFQKWAAEIRLITNPPENVVAIR